MSFPLRVFFDIRGCGCGGGRQRECIFGHGTGGGRDTKRRRGVLRSVTSAMAGGVAWIAHWGGRGE